MLRRFPFKTEKFTTSERAPEDNCHNIEEIDDQKCHRLPVVHLIVVEKHQQHNNQGENEEYNIPNNRPPHDGERFVENNE